MAAPAIELNGVVVNYGQQPVLDVSHLQIETGEIMVVLGPNGSGKSTLLRIAGLLEHPAAGEVLFGGKVIAGRRAELAQRRRMAAMFQDPLLFTGTVEDNVAYGLHARGIVSRDQALRAMSLLGIESLADRDVRSLSGGEAQRTALARALAPEPEILLLDEPTAYLDVPTRDRLRLELRDLLGELNITALYVTHDRAEARYLADRITVLLDGRPVHTAEPEQVFTRPATVSAARFVGMDNLLAGRVIRDDGRLCQVEWNGQVLLAASGNHRPGTQVTAGIMPECLRIGTVAGSTCLRGTVIRIVPTDHAWLAHVDAGVELVAAVTDTDLRTYELQPGQQCELSARSENVHLMTG